VRWRAGELDALLDEIAATGYGLTLGIHSRIDETVEHRRARLPRQRLRQPQHDRRRGRHAAVRRLGPVGHRARRPAARIISAASRGADVTVNTAAAGGNASLIATIMNNNDFLARAIAQGKGAEPADLVRVVPSGRGDDHFIDRTSSTRRILAVPG
jgi:hypothetical protein